MRREMMRGSTHWASDLECVLQIMCNVMRAYIYQVNVLLLNVCTQEDCPIINAGKKVDNTKLAQMAQLNVTASRCSRQQR